MAIINSYPHAVPTVTDTLIGTKYVENQEPSTKSFSIGDIIDLVPIVNPTYAYKVYTALLTQSGEDDVQVINGDEAIPLIIGTTYTIVDNSPGAADFTNVGAPNNNIGTSFVATGITPNSWGNLEIGWCIISYNTGAPVVTVLENTIGNVYMERVGVGVYSIQVPGLVSDDKIWLICGDIQSGGDAFFSEFYVAGYNEEIGYWNVVLASQDYYRDDVDLYTETPLSIEIRMYN